MTSESEFRARAPKIHQYVFDSALRKLWYSELYVHPNMSEEPGGTSTPKPAQIGLADNERNKFGREQAAMAGTPYRADRTQLPLEEHIFINNGVLVYNLVTQTRLFSRAIAWTRSDFSIQTP
jgi:hypothetical protein